MNFHVVRLGRYPMQKYFRCLVQFNFNHLLQAVKLSVTISLCT